ncbi:MAG: winged helix-turn-helix transcriptional regulator [[Clostridium] leptum]
MESISDFKHWRAYHKVWLSQAVPTGGIPCDPDKYLHELERDGFVQRIEYPAPPLRTEYSLTPMGLSLLPILQELAEWGEQ